MHTPSLLTYTYVFYLEIGLIVHEAALYQSDMLSFSIIIWGVFLQVSDSHLQSVRVHDQGKLVACGSKDGSITIMEFSDSISSVLPNEKHHAINVSLEITISTGNDWTCSDIESGLFVHELYVIFLFVCIQSV